MKRLYLFLGMVLVYSFVAVAMNNKVSKEKLKGKWDVKVAGAPNGYQDYEIDIKENEGVYKADILFVGSKDKISDQVFTNKDGKMTTNVYVQNEKVEVSIWEEKGIVQGLANSPSIGKLPMTFTRKKE